LKHNGEDNVNAIEAAVSFRRRAPNLEVNLSLGNLHLSAPPTPSLTSRAPSHNDELHVSTHHPQRTLQPPTMSARLGLRFGAAMRQPFRSQMRNTNRRFQSTTAAGTGPEASAFSKFFNSEVGPKPVHVGAPIMKVRSPPTLPTPQLPAPLPHLLSTQSLAYMPRQWGLVLAGASDFTRPASQLSLTQNMALTCTGAIWTRWCFIIKPRNLFLASVNFLLFLVGATQTTRVLRYQSELKGQTLPEAVAEKAGEAQEKVVEAVQEPGKVKEAVVGK